MKKPPKVPDRSGELEVFVSDEKIIEEYKKEIWNLANYSLKPKSEFLKWASYILVIGLLAGFILFFV